MVDWSKAPEGATHWGKPEAWNVHTYFKLIENSLHWFKNGQWSVFNGPQAYERSLRELECMEQRPAPEWPSDNRIDVIGQNGPSGEHYHNKYDRVIHGKYGGGPVTVDVYRVLNAFGPLSPEVQHAAKKLLAAGSRGHKDEKQDLLEAMQSIEARLKYLEDSNG